MFMTNHMHDKHGASYRPLTLFELVGSGLTDRPTDQPTNRARFATSRAAIEAKNKYKDVFIPH